MKNLIYPAIFNKENIGYSVSFPDLKGCVAEGNTIEDAYKTAKEILAIFVDGMKDAPTPSLIESIRLKQNQRLMFVVVDKIEEVKEVEKVIDIK
ncbi:MAG: type II toxin-antitoxin system HicB family antitoxin [Clostridia bacterium]